MELSRDFFTSLSDTTYGKPSDFYPLYTALNIEAKSDAVDIEESDVTEKNDTIIVRCFNNYTSSNGTFMQDSVILFITKNDNGALYIFDSIGLVEIDKDAKWFGKATGAFGKHIMNDQALSIRLRKLYPMMYDKYIETKMDLSEKVKISNWSWETSFDGTAHGDGRIINNLDYEISGIKYHVNYYDSKGNFMAEDEGSINKSLLPGERYSFSFWSSNVKHPSSANIKLDFSDKIVIDIMKSQTFSGKEYEEYVKNGINI